MIAHLFFLYDKIFFLIFYFQCFDHGPPSPLLPSSWPLHTEATMKLIEYARYSVEISFSLYYLTLNNVCYFCDCLNTVISKLGRKACLYLTLFIYSSVMTSHFPYGSLLWYWLVYHNCFVRKYVCKKCLFLQTCSFGDFFILVHYLQSFNQKEY